MGLDSAVGIATRYGLDGPGIESRWVARFSAHVQTGPDPHPASHTMDTGSFLGVNRPGRGVDHPPPSSAEVEGRAKLYLYSPSGPSWLVTGRMLPLPSRLAVVEEGNIEVTEFCDVRQCRLGSRIRTGWRNLLILSSRYKMICFYHGARATSGPGPPHYRGFIITLS